MIQNRASGAAADQWGRNTARALAQHLGATKPTLRSNECLLHGRRVVIKCAAPDTDSVGVTFKMLDRLDEIVGAFQRYDSAFELWSLRPSLFRTHMRDTRSRGASAGKVGLAKKALFESKGKSLGRVRL
jgi:hypothetical protein